MNESASMLNRAPRTIVAMMLALLLLTMGIPAARAQSTTLYFPATGHFLNDDQGLLSFSLGADGSGGDLLSRPSGGSRMPPTAEHLKKGLHYMHMDGRAVFRWAVAILCDTIQDVMAHSGYTTDQVNLYLPHQANIRIINAAIDVLHIPRSRVYNNLERYGNTSAGSIPLVLDEARQEDRIKPNDLVVLSGFGAGLAWGTALMRW